MQTNNIITFAAADHFSKPSRNFSLPLVELADKIAAKPLVDDKTKGGIIHFAKFPNGAPKRMLGNCAGATAFVLDYDGRNGDRVTRHDAEQACIANDISFLSYYSFSAELDDMTFRLVLPATELIPINRYKGGCYAACAAIGIAHPGKPLPASQGFFFQGRIDGELTTAPKAHSGSRNIDELFDINSVDAETFGKSEEQTITNGNTLNPDQIADAEEVIAAMRVGGHHLSNGSGIWHRVGASLANYGEQGERLFLMFSEGDKEFSEKDCIDKLQQKLRGGHATSIAHLFAIAAELGIKNPGTGHRPPPFEDFAAELASIAKEDKDIGEGKTTGRITTDMYPVMLTLDEMLVRFCYIVSGDRVVDRLNPQVVLPRVEFVNKYVSSLTEIPDPTKDNPERKKLVATTRLWFCSQYRIERHSLTWAPGKPEMTLCPRNLPAYNTFRERKLPPFVYNQSFVDIFLEQVRFLFGDRAEDFLNWFAHIEQRPGELPHTAWLNIALKTGIGRNWLGSVAVRLWPGEVACNYDLVAGLESQFNGSLSHKRLIIVDEIRIGGMSGHKVEQRMKSMITEEYRTINPKFGHTSFEFNCGRWMLFSNHRSAIPLSQSDRRYEVVINDSDPLSVARYRELYSLLKNEPTFALSVLKFLRDRDISSFNPGAHAKLTVSKEQLMNSCKSGISEQLACGLDDYKGELVAGDLIRQICGFTGDEMRKQGASINHALEDNGWIKLRRTKRGNIYVRSHLYEKWHKASPYDATEHLATYQATFDFEHELPQQRDA